MEKRELVQRTPSRTLAVTCNAEPRPGAQHAACEALVEWWSQCPGLGPGPDGRPQGVAGRWTSAWGWWRTGKAPSWPVTHQHTSGDLERWTWWRVMRCVSTENWNTIWTKRKAVHMWFLLLQNVWIHRFNSSEPHGLCQSPGNTKSSTYANSSYELPRGKQAAKQTLTF